jgi:hypothetical protein
MASLVKESVLMRLLVFVLTMIWTLNAAYDPLLLDAQSRIYPKLLFLEENIVKAAEKRSVKILIFYSPEDQEAARFMQRKIREYYDHEYRGHRFDVELISYEKWRIKSVEGTNAFILLKGAVDWMKSVIQIAQKLHIPTFVYDPNDLKLGAIFAIDIRQSTHILLNKEAWKRTGIAFVPQLYKIVSFQ